MASPVEIGRLALTHVADAARINSIDPPDNSVQAQHVATFYPMSRDECLEAFDWPFATTRHTLEESLIELANGEWGFIYLLPSNYIRAIKVCPPGAAEDHPGVPFKLETDSSEQDLVLLTNCADAVLHYVYREEETGRYTPTFVSALSLLLGSYLAGPLLKGRGAMAVKQGLRREFELVIKQAEARAGNSHRDDTNYAEHKPAWTTDR